ncbi:NUDIX hydrolase [Georgenia deserti]|uniref:NUDIX hydrolase n=1 Tax=Georgenia deserti TaxID=2093781 RepID=A0ABW4L019_9MICO
MTQSSSAEEWRAQLAELVARSRAGTLAPLGGIHTYDPQAVTGYREAAVLMLFTTTTPGSGPARARRQAASAEDDSTGLPDVFLVQRSRELRQHPGEIALPGGRLEVDEDAVSGALREAHEEIGLHPRFVEVIGPIAPLAMPHSRFVVTPVLGWTDHPGAATEIEPGEVLHTIRVPVARLVAPEVRCSATFAGRRSTGFLLPDGLVWGMTANLLDHVLAELGWAGPWDPGREVAIRRGPGGVWEIAALPADHEPAGGGR